MKPDPSGAASAFTPLELWFWVVRNRFPDFDMTWPEEAQVSWFKAFGELVRMRPALTNEDREPASE